MQKVKEIPCIFNLLCIFITRDVIFYVMFFICWIFLFFIDVMIVFIILHHPCTLGLSHSWPGMCTSEVWVCLLVSCWALLGSFSLLHTFFLIMVRLALVIRQHWSYPREVFSLSSIFSQVFVKDGSNYVLNAWELASEASIGCIVRWCLLLLEVSKEANQSFLPV